MLFGGVVMEETKESISYMGSVQKGMDKVFENTGEKALGVILNFIKEKYGQASVATGSAFKLYLKNSDLRYNKVKTLADLSEPRALEGKNGIYVDVFVDYKGKKVPTSTINDLMRVSNNIVVIGSGGSGKSMIMRHLFLNTHHRGEYIPILVELRRIEEANNDDALLNLIHSSIESFDVKLEHSQLEYSLRTGKYVLLLDGLDEVKGEFREKTKLLIQQLSNKYPLNMYVVSSREEGVSFNELETYTLVKACPLEKQQAILLTKKLGQKNEKTEEFSKLLECELYDKHRDFASNPLLLTMMYITFIDNNKIPEHLTDFYDSAYDALYKRHDANKEGLFKRDYKCKMLGEREFKDLFSYFCFQSYFQQQYEFSKEEINIYIQRGIEKLGLEELLKKPEDFFDDIKDIVCLIVEEGNKYKFAHRSFQTYFAAYYTSIHITDEQQKLFFGEELNRGFSYNEDFFHMLYRLGRERFSTNILEPGIKTVLEKIEKAESDRFEFLKISCQAMSVHEGILFRGINSVKQIDIPYERSIVMLFESLFMEEKMFDREMGSRIIDKMKPFDDLIEFEIEDLVRIEPLELRNEIIELVLKYYRIESLLAEVQKWYSERTARRKKMKEEQERNERLLLL